MPGPQLEAITFCPAHGHPMLGTLLPAPLFFPPLSLSSLLHPCTSWLPLLRADQQTPVCRCFWLRYLVKCLLVAVCRQSVVLMIPWPGLRVEPQHVACQGCCVVYTAAYSQLASCLLNLVGEKGGMATTILPAP